MKTGKEVLDIYKGQASDIGSFVSLESIIDIAIREVVKEQDKLTRHACAEAVIKDDVISDDYWEHINKSNAYDACLNVKAL